jgi:hypothetical protein
VVKFWKLFNQENNNLIGTSEGDEKNCKNDIEDLFFNIFGYKVKAVLSDQISTPITEDTGTLDKENTVFLKMENKNE